MRIALLISGSGTTAGAIAQACRSGVLPGVTPACVITSDPACGGIARLKGLGIAEEAIHVIAPAAFGSAEQFGEAILAALRAHGAEFVGQYGWMAKTPANVIAAYESMIVNQHPGPLDPGRPDFGGKGMYGRRVHAARLLFVRITKRAYWTEAVAQRSAAEFDAGAVLRAAQVSIMPDDTVDELRARVLATEHEVQIETLRDFARGTVREIVRDEPLVRAEEIEVLNHCKRAARLLYPHG